MAKEAEALKKGVEETAKVSAELTDEALAKSIDALAELLEKDSADENVEEAVEKAVIGTGGGLQGETPSDGDINTDIVPDEEEDEGEDPVAASDELEAALGRILTMPTDVQDGVPVKKSEGAESEDEMEEDEGEEELSDEDMEMAKSLAAVFAESESIRDESVSNDFAKSLVMANIEGLSIAHDEMNKSLAALEQRNAAKVDGLAKALTVIAKAVASIQKDVRGVANNPVRTTPKSAGYIAKSFGGETSSAANTLSKSQIAEALEKRVMDRKLDSMVLAKYEATGEIDPALLAEIQNGSGR